MTLTISDFIIYSFSFIYVYYKAGMNNYGWSTFFILSFPVLFFGLCAFEPFLHQLTAKFNPKDDRDTCYVYNPNDPYAIIIELTGIFNGILVNIVMLKVLGVAAVLRCESLQQEEVIVKRHNKLVKLYIPFYLIAQALVYGCQLWIFSDQSYTLPVMVTLIVSSNFVKLCMTFSLGIMIFIFGYRLKGTIDMLIF